MVDELTLKDVELPDDDLFIVDEDDVDQFSLDINFNKTKKI